MHPETIRGVCTLNLMRGFPREASLLLEAKGTTWIANVPVCKATQSLVMLS